MYQIVSVHFGNRLLTAESYRFLSFKFLMKDLMFVILADFQSFLRELVCPGNVHWWKIVLSVILRML